MSRCLAFAVILSAGCHICPVALAGEVEAGAAAVEITGPAGYRMSGYFNERLNTGIHDPLKAKAVVLKQDGIQAALVFCDLIGVSLDVSRRARELAAEKTGIPAENILIAATHSHTGPLYSGALRKHFHDRSVAEMGKDPHELQDYPAHLVKKLVEVILLASQAVQPAQLTAGAGVLNGLSFNRRFLMRDGSVRFNPGKLNADIVRPVGPIDPQVGLVRFSARANGRDLAVLTVFALHLDTVGGTEYAADYPFYLERNLQRALGLNCESLFGAGTCGDINHIDVTHDRPQKGQEEAGRIGAKLADVVTNALPALKSVAAPRLAVRRTIVAAPLQEFSPEQVEEAQRQLFLVGTNQLPFLKQVQAYKIMARQLRPGGNLPMEVQVFRLGDELALVGLPGEIFVELGLAIKAASPFATTLVIELCNDAPGYVPTKKAFTEGSYETVNSLIAPGGGELLIEAAVRMLKELKAAN